MPVDRAVVTNRVVGDFALREKIGEGGFGTVYIAEQQSLGRLAVVKVMRRSLGVRRDAVERFLLEARLASRLDHPCAAHIYAAGTEADGTLWIAMELVKGTSLDKLLDAGPLAIDRVVPMIERLCEAVQTAHEQGIVHRDIKPANVMVASKAGRLMPKLLDFGIAKQLVATAGEIQERPASQPLDATVTSQQIELEHTAQVSTQSTGGPTNSLTQDGQILGSPPYMAPEQWTEPLLVGPATDQYALALLCYEALAGQRARRGTTVALLAQQHLEDPLPPHDGIPPAVHAVLARAAAKSIADRFADLDQFTTALRGAAGLGVELDEQVPTLPADLAAAWTTDAPQPIAEAIAAIASARTVTRVGERTMFAARVIARWLGVTALACRQRAGQVDPTTSTRLRELRRRAPRDVEWIDLAVALAKVVDHPETWPVAELVTWCSDGEAVAMLRDLVRHEAPIVDADRASTAAHRQVATLATVLGGLGWLLDYTVGREVEGGVELWLGTRTDDRIVQRGLSDGNRVVVLDADGARVLSLAPLVTIAAPMPGEVEEMFVFAGPSPADAALYCALPRGYERDDLVAWDELGTHLLDASARAEHEGDDDRPPYPGLAAFTTSDRASFVGREREASELVNRLRAQSIVAVVGPSGAGKSSFLAAGVVPLLAASSHTITIRPGDDPVGVLADLCERMDGSPYRDGQRAASNAGLPARLVALAEHRKLVLIVDQAEELFTQGADDADRIAFAEAIVAFAATPHASVVLGLRDDFLVRLDELAPWRGVVTRSVQILAVPGRAELERIVSEPARRRGYDFEDPELPARMVDAVLDRAGALPLLSFAAAELWERRDRHFKRITKSAYEQIGGVTGALVQHADGVVDKMTVAEKRLVRLAFRRLLTAEGARVVHGRSELVTALGDSPAASHIVEQLLAARLVVSRDDEGGERIEIIHEALTRTWPRLEAWRQEDGMGAKLHEQLAAAAKHWDERIRPDGLLWRDAALVELRRWLATNDGGLTAVEAAFAFESEMSGKRSRRRKLGVLTAAFVALSGTVVVLGVSSQRIAAQRADAVKRVAAGFEERGRIAELGGDSTRALLYLAEAARLGEAGPAHDLLVERAATSVDSLARVAVHGDAPIWRTNWSMHRLVTLQYSSVRMWDRDTAKPIAMVDDTMIGGPSGDGMAVITRRGDVVVFDAAGVVKWRAERALTDKAFVAGITERDNVLATFFGKTVKLWDREHGTPLATITRDGNVSAVALDPDARHIAVQQRDQVAVYDIATHASVTCTIGDHATGTRFSPDGRFVVAGGNDAVVRVCDVATGEIVHSLSGHLGVLDVASFDPSGRVLATASTDGTVRLWNAASGAPLGVLSGHRGPVRELAWSPDGSRVVTGGDDMTVRVWDIESAVQLASLEGHGGRITGLVWDASSAVESSSLDGTVRQWDLVRAINTKIIHPHGERPDELTLSPEGARAIGTDLDHHAYVWNTASLAETSLGSDVASAKPLGSDHVVAATAHGLVIDHTVVSTDSIVYVAVLPDGSRFATVSADRTIRMWSATGVVLGTAKLDFDAIQLLLDPSGRWLIAVERSGTTGAAVFDAATMREVTRLAKNTPTLWAEIDRDRVVIIAEHSVHVFDLGTWTGPVLPTVSLTLSTALAPDGRIITASMDAMARVWDRFGNLITALPGNGRPESLDVSKDGRLLAVATNDGSVDVWDLASYRMIATMRGHHDSVLAVKFDPSRSRVLSWGLDGRLASWALPNRTRSQADLSKLVKCRVPLQLEGETVLPRTIDFDDPSCR